MYIFENWDRIARSRWVPTPEDMLRIRVRTSGIVEQDFKVREESSRDES